MCNSNFLVAFVVARRCLQYLKPLTVKLQKRARDVVDAYKKIANISNCFQGLRENIDAVFSGTWFQEDSDVAESFGTTITMLRSSDRQTLRENHPADTAEEYYRRSVAVPFLDHLVLQMKDRFQNAELAKDGLQLVPDSIIQLPNDYMPVPGGVQGLADLWHSDLPDVGELPAEYHRWCTRWRGQPQQPVPCTVQGALEACSKDFYPNIHVLLKLLCTSIYVTRSVF